MIDKALLDKFRSGACTPEELAQLKAYFEQEDVSALENSLQADWDDLNDLPPLPQAVNQRIWQRLERSVQDKPTAVIRHLQPTWKPWHKVAAAILLLFATASIYWLLQQWNSAETVIVANTTDAPMQITLEDSSAIWLSEGSTIQYQQPFSKKKRDIFLKGEAFFEVAKDSLRSFTVFAGGFSTTALGTSFNIRAFEDSSDVKIALVTGKVGVSRLRDGKPQPQHERILTPGKQLRYNFKNQNVVVENFNSTVTLAWREGKWVFDNESLATVLQRLEKQYQVDIQFDAKKLSQCFIRTSFDKTESLKNILTVLQFSDHLEFTQRGSTYAVTAGSTCE
jgi:ferric-dicitrate binding protein FerR (iron transport regulator)